MTDNARPLNEVVTMTADPTGEERLCLSPQFVEWMMGLPIGWTDLELAATESSLRPQPQPGDTLQGGR